MSNSGPKKKDVKYELLFSDQMDKLLKRRAAINRISLANQLRNAIAVYEYFAEEIMKDPGLRAALVNEDGRIVHFIDIKL